MTQEDKDLLLKDLCARLPYGVKILHKGWNYEWDQELSTLEKITGIDEKFIYTKVIDDNGEEYTSSRHTISLFNDKPYLFPLSSMTEEQKEELKREISKQTDILIERMKNDDCGIDCGKYHFHSLLELEWCIKNHFDYRGLIPKDLAIDATGLNVYEL